MNFVSDLHIFTSGIFWSSHVIMNFPLCTIFAPILNILCSQHDVWTRLASLCNYGPCGDKRCQESPISHRRIQKSRRFRIFNPQKPIFTPDLQIYRTWSATNGIGRGPTATTFLKRIQISSWFSDFSLGESKLFSGFAHFSWCFSGESRGSGVDIFLDVSK